MIRRWAAALTNALAAAYKYATCKHEEWEQVVPTPPPHQLRCKNCGCAIRCDCTDCRIRREPHRDW